MARRHAEVDISQRQLVQRMERGAGLISIPQKGGCERGRRTIAPDRLEGPGGVGDKQVKAPSRVVDGETPVSWTMTRQFHGDERTVAQDVGSRFERQKITWVRVGEDSWATDAAEVLVASH